MIIMHGVSKTYPSQISALSEINLEVSQGEFVFIVGPGGSGKSTLLRILSYAEKPTRGEILILGMLITQPRFKKIHQLRRMMGIVSQDFKLLKDRSVNENVAFTLEVTGHGRKEARFKASEILNRVGLAGREHAPIQTLSAGEQQRVAIARALVQAPSMLLVDEPTRNLDAKITVEVMKIFSEIHQKGTTVLFATQYTGLVKYYPYRIIRLQEGKKVEDTKAQQIDEGNTEG